VKDAKDINGFFVCYSHRIAVRKAPLSGLKSRIVNSHSFVHSLKPPNFELCAFSLFLPGRVISTVSGSLLLHYPALFISPYMLY